MSLVVAAQSIREKLTAEDAVHVSIALFGQPGSGKSSLINRLTGQKLAAEGVRNDVTTERQDYEWNGLTLVDLPGYDTSKFPADEYLSRFGVMKFDLLLCVFDGKFHEADSALFHEVSRRGKICLFVRNKHDTLWQDGMELGELEQEVVDNVHQQVGGSAEVFFTSCRSNTGLDELEQAIKRRLEPAKQERWVRAAKAYTRAFLFEKKNLCEQRVTWTAAISAAGGTIPIPGANFAVDLPILLSLFRFVRDTYGLTDRVLATKEYAVPALAPMVNGVIRFCSTEGILMLLKQCGSLVAAEQFAKYVPVVGTVIAASLGFAVTWKVGSYYLDDCHKLAAAVLDARLQVPQEK
ncbi:MAG: GTPase domain-containing protein [Pirellulaceae bacterium]|nr:GTPase domain-containing protein [Pirellulaceae bacterium]